MYTRPLRFTTSMIFGSSGSPSVTMHAYPPLEVPADAGPSVYIVQLAFVSDQGVGGGWGFIVSIFAF